MCSPGQMHFYNNNLDSTKDWVQKITLDIKNLLNNNYNIVDLFTYKYRQH